MIRLVLVGALVGTVVLANWLTTVYGLVPAAPGLEVIAGTYAAGLAFGLRDALHEHGGVGWVLSAILAGAGVSFVVAAPAIAFASAVAFLLAELADFAVYARLRRAGWRRALIASNAVGAVADTLLFLWLAGFPVTGPSIAGQLLAKAVWCTGLVLAVREVARRAVSRQPVHSAGA